MMIRRSAGLAAGISLALAAQPAVAQMTEVTEIARAVQRALYTYGLIALRTQIDLTYDSVTVDARTLDPVINGLEIYPAVPWAGETPCVVSIDRVAIADGSQFDTFETVIEVSGVSLPPACVEPQQAALLQGFGYETLEISGASIRLAYDLPTAGADLEVNAAIVDAGELNLAADFEYLSIRTPSLAEIEAGDSSDPIPVAMLRSAELSFDNRGVWDRVEPFLASQFNGDLSVLPLVASQLIQQSLGGGAAPGPEVMALSENVATELERFLAAKDRLVVSVAPEDGVLLTEDLFDDPQTMIARLEPTLSAASSAQADILPPDQLRAALAGGQGLDTAARLAAGTALITGVGAPRAPAEGRALLAPLAEAWEPRAAVLVAEALAAAGNTREAYAMALRAMAGGEPGSTGLVDRLEGQLDVDALLSAQDDVMRGWPDRSGWDGRVASAQQAGDILALRRLAFDASVGNDVPRNYEQAYFLASLAAAAGDRGSAALRDRLDARFLDLESGAPARAWATVAGSAASAALDAWTDGGLAERLTAE